MPVTGGQMRWMPHPGDEAVAYPGEILRISSGKRASVHFVVYQDRPATVTVGVTLTQR